METPSATSLGVTISAYPHIRETKNGKQITLETFLDCVKAGRWQDKVLPIRAIADKALRQQAKEQLPYVTISGIFSERNIKGLISHSGYVGMDLDDLNDQLEPVRTMINDDPYVYASFTSVSGTGLCVLFSIDGEKHKEAFDAIADYLINKYRLIPDFSGSDVSRPRYVSFDPFLFINNNVVKWKKYLPAKKEKALPPTLFVQSEFDEVVKQMIERKVSCVEDYRDWINVGFALADKLGENGRNYFHQLSSISNKYTPDNCNRQYDNCLRRKGGNKITISTIYFYAKQAGISIVSEKTKRIGSITSSSKKSGLSKDQIIFNLEKFENISPDDSRPIVDQAYDSSFEFDQDENSLVQNVINWLKHTQDLRRNVITRKIENAGKVYEDIEFNSLFLRCKNVFPSLSFELYTRIIFSDNTPSYNPFFEFYEKHKDIPYNNEIERFWDCFEVDDRDKLHYFGTKWLYGIIESIHGLHNRLMLVFAGKQLIGKTEAFRRLMPLELRQYYAESKLDSGKDDEILMCQKLIIMDDEMGGKSKKENKRLKELTSKQVFSLREPYGRANVDLTRIANLCGTTNDLAVLNDSTGNSRIIPIEMFRVDRSKLNSVDKIALFIELFRRFERGERSELIENDVLALESKTSKFEEFSQEYELILNHFTPVEEGNDYVKYTATEIKNYLETKTVQKLSLRKIGMELKRLGFYFKIEKINSRTAQVYYVRELQSSTGFFQPYGNKPNEAKTDEEFPF